MSYSAHGQAIRNFRTAIYVSAQIYIRYTNPLIHARAMSADVETAVTTPVTTVMPVENPVLYSPAFDGRNPVYVATPRLPNADRT